MPDIDPVIQDDATQIDGPLILVIEDNLSEGPLLERRLWRLGYRVEVVRGGGYGLIRARETKPAAIILDIELPGMDGYQVLEKLQADTSLRSVPVIVSSANHEARQHMMRSGARDFLAKPVDRNLLEAVLSQCVVPVNPSAQADA